jgi:hypothetical protein
VPTFTTPANVLTGYLCFLGAGGGVFGGLRLEHIAYFVYAVFSCSSSVHASLQCVALPSEQVVAVLTVSGPRVKSVPTCGTRRKWLRYEGYSEILLVAKAVNERLVAILEIFGIIECRGVPLHLVHELRDSDWVRTGTSRAGKYSSARRVRHVTTVIGAIQVLPIPA